MLLPDQRHMFVLEPELKKRKRMCIYINLFVFPEQSIHPFFPAYPGLGHGGPRYPSHPQHFPPHSGDPEVFPGQLGGIIPPASPGFPPAFPRTLSFSISGVSMSHQQD